MLDEAEVVHKSCRSHRARAARTAVRCRTSLVRRSRDKDFRATHDALDLHELELGKLSWGLSLTLPFVNFLSRVSLCVLNDGPQFAFSEDLLNLFDLVIVLTGFTLFRCSDRVFGFPSSRHQAISTLIDKLCIHAVSLLQVEQQHGAL